MIDTHCHLNFSDAFPDPPAAIERAKENGVRAFIVVGCDEATSRRALDLAEEHDEVYACVGWHPNYAAGFDDDKVAIVGELASHPKAVAIGEVGLDYHWDHATPQQQRHCTLLQLQLAADLGMSVVFHCREAWDDLLDWLEADAPRPPRMVFHCFSGNEEHARRALALGGFLGVDGPLTYPKNDRLRSIVANSPRERVLVETDSPYLTPHPYRGKPNEPALLPLVNRALAEVLGIPPDECVRLTTDNARAAFPALIF